MVLIGWYIALASVYCFIVNFLDFLGALVRKKFWFPIEFSPLNAAFLTVIAVAMKLPMDLTSPMLEEVDQVVKVGSLAFMCTIMSNMMPSLAVMDNKSLVENVTGFSIFVITMVVNVGIQIKTQVITHESFHPFVLSPSMAACIYMGMLLFLLMIFISSTITIPTSKKVLEVKYKATLNDQNLQEDLPFDVEKLRQLLKRHWIMAQTSSPQFVMASTPLSSASSIICAISMLIYMSLFCNASIWKKGNKSVYKGSAIYICLYQLLGVILGVCSIYRCFTVLRFKSFANQNRNHFSVFKVDKYWTQKLCEWKESPLILFSIVQVDDWLKNNILSIFFEFQRVIVVLCKIIELIPIVAIILFMRCSYYFKSLKEMLFSPHAASSSEDTYEDLCNCVLLLEDDVQPTKYLVKRILDSMDKLIDFCEKKQINNLLQLLEKSVAFEGIEMFDTDEIQSLLPVEVVNCWNLPIISLTCIAVVIPNIDEDVVDNLLKSVREGLRFTRTVEENLNKASEYVNIQRATTNLWCEVIKNHKWLDTNLRRSAYQGKAPTDIIKSFAHTAKDIVTEFNRSTNGEPVVKENLPTKVIVANSMYRIAKTILHTYETNNLEIIEDELFSRLSNMIADISTACLINIPRVIISKCRESAIEKRADSAEGALRLFARSTEIIKRLETRELPNMDPEKMGFIDEWRLHFKQP
ncbi:hypothetical protein HanPSC8_Chr06g0240201 [Helianthus annuus]|nr:hypothetical protein HanPSC8_Chr06g0240201 [Helianthus annuus]